MRQRTVFSHLYPLVISLTLFLSGCATAIPPDINIAPSYKMTATGDTFLGRYAQSTLTAANPGQSAFYLLDDGLESFMARVVLAKHAERTLDLQYYIYEQDVTGKLLTSALLAAADRGVRVRLLLDDVGVIPEDHNLLSFDQHDNIEVRLFNPQKYRGALSSQLEMAGSFSRLNHRMHNKLMVADNQAMVVGGRNIGDEYFSTGSLDFHDVDTIAVGPLVDSGSSSFDEYWNSGIAMPIAAWLDDNDRVDAASLRTYLTGFARDNADSVYVQAVRSSAFAENLRNNKLAWQLARSQLFWDPPLKASRDSAPESEPFLGQQLTPLVKSARSHLRVSSAYFVPRDKGVDFFSELTGRGVEVEILTNSLASTDVLVVHAGYRRYREPLLRAGVSLWELNPGSSELPEKSWFSGSSKASLHAKTFILDDRAVIIGSVNLDPRSLLQNTEIAVWIESPTIAHQLSQRFHNWTDAEHAFNVRLDQQNNLYWRGGEPEEVWRKEPQTSWWQRFKVRMLSWLPIEKQI